MATVQALFGSAIRAAAQGYTATEFYRTLQAAGQGTRTSTVYQLFKQAKQLVTAAETEAFANPAAIPSGLALGTWPTKNATGIRQNVKILYKDKVTGDYKVTYWSTVTKRGITRQQAIDTAVNAYSASAERYNQELVGAFHSSAQQLMPGVILQCNGVRTGLRKTSKSACHPE